MLKFAGSDSRCVSEVDTAMKKGFLLQATKGNAETADTGPAPMDVDPPFKPWGKQTRFACVKQCEKFRAQELAECLLESLIEIRIINQPSEHAKLAGLIQWVTDELGDRDCLPQTIQDIDELFSDTPWFQAF